MTRNELVIIDTGVANLASVSAAFARLGVPAVVSIDAGAARSCGALVLPGVGTFGAGIDRLRSFRLEDVLRDRLDMGAPTLAICLGLQLLGTSSEESQGKTGLGVTGWQAKRFGEDVRTPQFGWNRVTAGACSLIRDGYAYFANSYRVLESEGDWKLATADHGGTFVAAAERGSCLACQFHPELSGLWGSDLLARWLERAQIGVCRAN